MTLMVALAKFFRDSQGQSVGSFIHEVKRLAPKDLEELKLMLEKTLDIKIEG